MRILQETPPSGVLYYKYKPRAGDRDEDEKKDEEAEILEPKTEKKRHHPILETPDKSKIKIRFNDLPMSRCTQNGLFKAKFVKMTEV